MLKRSCEKRSVGSIIGELVSKDGLNPHMIMNSNLLLGWMRKDGIDVPKSRTTIAKYVHEEAENLRDGVMKELAQMKEKGQQMQQKFSLSLDEATTRSKYRVLNIELYSEIKNYNLGMVLVDKTCPAEKAFQSWRRRGGCRRRR